MYFAQYLVNSIVGTFEKAVLRYDFSPIKPDFMMVFRLVDY